MAPDDGGSVPWLVLERVERDQAKPTRLVGALWFGGHRLRIVLDFGRPPLGFVEHVDVPELLGIHEPSRRAVIAAMARIAAGEAIPLPYDLTDEIRDVDPPFPLRPLDEARRAQLDAAAAGVDLRVRSIERTGSSPELVHADLLLDGRPISVRVKLYAGPGAVPVVGWLPGPDPDELTAGQRHAIEQALLERHNGAGAGYGG
jgi:hypothetical protein